MKLPVPTPPDSLSPQIVVRYDIDPTPQAEAAHAALQQAVAEALDRKRRLGQYAVFWLDGQVVQVEPEALPTRR